jgi:hypothetical protein
MPTDLPAVEPGPDELVLLAAYAHEPLAAAVAEFLAHSGIAARVSADSPVPGLTREARVLVPRAQLAQARTLCESNSVPEAELERLAVAAPRDD